MSNTYKGLGLSPGTAEGPANVISQREQITGRYDILGCDVVVIDRLSRQLTSELRECAAMVVGEERMTSHGGNASRDMGIPAVGNCPTAVEEIESGQTLSVNGDEGKICIL